MESMQQTIDLQVKTTCKRTAELASVKVLAGGKGALAKEITRSRGNGRVAPGSLFKAFLGPSLLELLNETPMKQAGLGRIWGHASCLICRNSKGRKTKEHPTPEDSNVLFLQVGTIVYLPRALGQVEPALFGLAMHSDSSTLPAIASHAPSQAAPLVASLLWDFWRAEKNSRLRMRSLK